MSTQARPFADVIERVEQVRRRLGLTKSAFSHSFGMKPQTYNNFIGAQGSKPNVELITGVVREFQVSPGWLLNGEGEAFIAQPPAAPPCNVAVLPLPSQLDQAGLERILDRIHELNRLLRQVSTELDDSIASPIPPLDRAIEGLKRNFVLRPAETADHLATMLAAFEEFIRKEKELLASGNEQAMA